MNENGENPEVETGGRGEEWQRGNGNPRREAKLIERLSRRKDWQIPEGAFERLPVELYLMATDRELGPDGQAVPVKQSPRTKLAAARALTAMHGQNQSNDPAPQQVDHTHAVQIVLPHNGRDDPPPDAVIEGEPNGNGKG
jgi:hypothetical protein